jgi:hypothetical protein
MTTAERTLLPTFARAIDLLANRARMLHHRMLTLAEKSARRDAYAETARTREELRRLWLR